MTMPAGGPPRRKGSWVRSHKGVVIGGVALAGAAGLALYERSKSGSGSGDNTSAGTDSTTSSSPATYDDTGDYDSLEGQLANLQSSVSKTQNEEQDQSRTNQRQWKRIDQLKHTTKSGKKPPKKKKK